MADHRLPNVGSVQSDTGVAVKNLYLRHVFSAFMFTAILMVVSCAVSPQTNEHTNSGPKPLPAPKADHHLHIVSEDLVKIFNGPALPAVELPKTFTRLLDARAENWNQKDELRALYAPDAVIVIDEWSGKTGIFRGADVVAKHLTSRFGSPYTMSAVAFDAGRDSAHITGYYTRGNGTDIQRIGYFQLGLRRSDDGQWRIAAEAPSFPRGPRLKEVEAHEVIAMMDKAGVERGAILSAAAGVGGYWVDIYRDQKTPADRYPKVRAENDWLAEQVARFPDRLISFCGFNVLEPYALEELQRCSDTGHSGLKLHFEEDHLDLLNKSHVNRARETFALANKLRLPIIVHVGNNEGGFEDTAQRMQEFFDVVVAAAPDVTVQIAHLWGGGDYSEAGLAAFADLMSSSHPARKYVYIDVADITRVIEQYGERAPAIWETVAAQIRRIGTDRILFGSDGGFEAYHGPAEAWKAFVESAPLTDREFRDIANNLAPYWH